MTGAQKSYLWSHEQGQQTEGEGLGVSLITGAESILQNYYFAARRAHAKLLFTPPGLVQPFDQAKLLLYATSIISHPVNCPYRCLPLTECGAKTVYVCVCFSALRRSQPQWKLHSKVLFRAQGIPCQHSTAMDDLDNGPSMQRNSSRLTAIAKLLNEVLLKELYPRYYARLVLKPGTRLFTRSPVNLSPT
jgi:hypothetical protein